MERVIEIGGVRVRIAPTAEDEEGLQSFNELIEKLKNNAAVPQINQRVSEAPRHVQILLSVDFDAVAGWLGTGQHPRNCLADYSSGFFAGHVGVGRLLSVFKRLGVADKITWFIPGHSMETFPAETKSIVQSGAEIALHGYSHEDATKLDAQQEEDVFDKCITLAQSLTGKRPVGYRAPVYRLSQQTVNLLEKKGFLYDSSLSWHDSQLHQLSKGPSPVPVDYSQPAHTWMHPCAPSQPSTVVGVPTGWYMEDMTPLQYLPNIENSHGYVPAQSIVKMWQDRFNWLWKHGPDGNGLGDFVFPLVLHPDTSGMAHIIGSIENMVQWLKSWGSEVEFVTYEAAARSFLKRQMEKSDA
ncbi:uncharacterized protein CTRU02_203029 [Colletotrichum truncatum]|uniref:Uncharacterized protein n=1 Tax=Colletotrichum truncatum TaxID=5467 RepID=A0ACC3Z8A7_COLTU|nr:uncharacterized protein CTRU02_13150 [Colletotrichum truncatum]KAF6783642.1 hypothetical protein CTRU02_13150 [Colletotrichum truncatum]